LFAIALLAAHDAALGKQLDAYRAEQTRAAREQQLPVTGLSDGLVGL
jgi:phosphoribosylcarboxyaminoimidazole (NCAIR) mutase